MVGVRVLRWGSERYAYEQHLNLSLRGVRYADDVAIQDFSVYIRTVLDRHVAFGSSR